METTENDLTTKRIPSGDRSGYMTLREVAEFLRVCVRTVRREIDRGLLRAVRIGRALRVSKRDLEDYLEKGGGQCAG